jgi:hypothetical protein
MVAGLGVLHCSVLLVPRSHKEIYSPLSASLSALLGSVALSLHLFRKACLGFKKIYPGLCFPQMHSIYKYIGMDLRKIKAFFEK